MRVLVFRDIHGRSDWSKYIDRSFDLAIFLGDYFDSFEISPAMQVKNFEDILNFKERHGDKVKLLLGNHDMPYLFSPAKWICPGYNHQTKFLIGEKLENLYKEGQLKLAESLGNILFSHAGISQGWINGFDFYFYDRIFNERPELDAKSLATFLNHLLEIEDIQLTMNSSIRGGIYQYGSPLWAHDTEIFNNPILGISQVFGHTPKPFIRHKIIKETESFLLCLDSYEVAGYEMIF